MMNRNIVPIAFCFDPTMELAAGVCITSLMENASPTTFYDIYILHSDTYLFKDSKINELLNVYKNCKITYRSVGSIFENAFEIRGISLATYYRLLIPEIIPEYDKIIYSDVDVIFRNDLSEIYKKTDLTHSYVAGVTDASYFSPKHQDYIKSLNLSCEEYIYAGNLIFNSALIRQNGIVEFFIEEVNKKNYIYQDMDVLNIVCKGHIKRMPPIFCLSAEVAKYAANSMVQPLYTLDELIEAQLEGIIHYTGPKPWREQCINFDIWWEYYRKSIFFDSTFYYQFFLKQMTANDRLSLLQRLKLLARYFKNGKVS